MKFKVGDKVVGNKNHFAHRVGKYGAVTELAYMGFWVKWDEGDVQYSLWSEVDIAPNT